MTEELEKEFILPNTLSAMAKTFYVKVEKDLRGGIWHLKQGSKVTGVKVIANGEKIRDIKRLIDSYLLPDGSKTKSEDWYKVRGTAVISDGIETYKNCEFIGISAKI